MSSTTPETDAAIDASCDRVARRFPHHSRAHIHELVLREYAALADRPIRMYVSNLVEHSARTRLTLETVRASRAA